MTDLAARASWVDVKPKGRSLTISFLGSSLLRILEILKDLFEGGEEVFGEGDLLGGDLPLCNVGGDAILKWLSEELLLLLLHMEVVIIGEGLGLRPLVAGDGDRLGLGIVTGLARPIIVGI